MKTTASLMSALFLMAGSTMFANSIAVYGTGMGPGGPLADGTIDSYYSLSSTDTSNPGLAAYVTNQNTLANGWVADSAVSKWISPTATGTNGFSKLEYDYTTTFDLTGLDASTATLSGMISADDGTAIFLNGHSVDSLFGTWTKSVPFQINSGFISGVNTLTFAVQNYGSGPTGLDASISGSATATPEPASAVLVGAGLLAAALLSRRQLAKVPCK